MLTDDSAAEQAVVKKALRGLQKLPIKKQDFRTKIITELH